MLQQVTHASIVAAINALDNPIAFGTDQAAANRLISRLHPTVCDRCESDGRIPGKRKRCKCSRCHAMKYGYMFNGAVYWTGWASTTKAIYARLAAAC